MYPNQNPYPGQTPPPANYLDQIAPVQPKKQLFTPGPKLFIFIGIVLVILVMIFVFIGNLVTGAQEKPMKQLAARLASTETIVGDSQKNIKSSQLRSLNSSLKIFLTNTNRDIATPMKNVGIDVARLDGSIKTAESGSDVTKRLEDARLNAVFDRTYAREMAYRLETTIALMKQIYNSTNSPSLKAFLSSSYDSLQPTQKAFADFNAANG